MQTFENKDASVIDDFDAFWEYKKQKTKQKLVTFLTQAKPDEHLQQAIVEFSFLNSIGRRAFSSHGHLFNFTKKD